MTTALSPAEHAELPAMIARARSALDAAASLPAVTEVRDQADALAGYVAQRGASLGVCNEFARIRIEAERKAGDLLEKLAPKGGDPKSRAATLPDLGVTKRQSVRWRKLARVPAPRFEKALTDLAASEELTTAAVLKVVAEPKTKEPAAAGVLGQIRRAVSNLAKAERSEDPASAAEYAGTALDLLAAFLPAGPEDDDRASVGLLEDVLSGTDEDGFQHHPTMQPLADLVRRLDWALRRDPASAAGLIRELHTIADELREQFPGDPWPREDSTAPVGDQAPDGETPGDIVADAQHQAGEQSVGASYRAAPAGAAGPPQGDGTGADATTPSSTAVEVVPDRPADGAPAGDAVTVNVTGPHPVNGRIILNCSGCGKKIGSRNHLDAAQIAAQAHLDQVHKETGGAVVVEAQA